MRILALEFSSPQLSVALLEADSQGHELRVSEMAEANTRSARALGLIESVLNSAQVDRALVDCLAIGLGPGSYSGIRSAIAIAQGWQIARNIRLVGISSAECAARRAQLEGIRGSVDVVIDAQRNEFYLATFELGDEHCRNTRPLRLATMPEAKAQEQAGRRIIGPEATKWFAAGQVIVPRAVTLARMAVLESQFVPGEKLEPIYLRETSFVKAPPPRVWPDEQHPKSER